MNPRSADAAFPGTANLEVMREARRYNAFLARLVTGHAPPGGRTLDFGAGSGTIATLVAAALPGGAASMLCVETDPALRASLARAGLAAVPGIAEAGREVFDYAYTINVLEHIDDDGRALRGLRDVLRPGARLLIYVPAFMILYSAMDAQVGHVRRYRRRPLERLCRDAGLHVERSRYVDSLGFAASLALRLLGSRSASLDPAMVRFYDRFVFPVSRALDRLFGGLFGKNIVLVATRPREAA